jgi:hypothetical protein
MRNYGAQRLTITRILQKLIVYAKEVGLESNIIQINGQELFSDTKGVDMLAQATLQGIHLWLNYIREADITSQPWFSAMQMLVNLLVR